ncbi:MAG: hypothetical protein NVS3B12_17440 [Acidimicrobiales bacterium]
MADTLAAAPDVRPATASGGPDVPAAGTTAADHLVTGDLITGDLITGELLVEEISIDGMCGVY